MVMKPLFEIEFYKCNKCEKTFTVSCRSRPWLPNIGKLPFGDIFSREPECPNCGSNDVSRRPTPIVY